MRDRTRLSLLACVFVGCLHLHPGEECSGEVANLDVIEPRRLRARVLLTRDGSEERHELVVRTTFGRIEAIGLTPMGTVAYRITHDRQGIEVENRVGRHLGLSPRLAYDAVARAYLDPSRAFPVGAMENPDCGYEARVALVEDVPLAPATSEEEPLTTAPDAPPPP